MSAPNFDNLDPVFQQWSESMLEEQRQLRAALAAHGIALNLTAPARGSRPQAQSSGAPTDPPVPVNQGHTLSVSIIRIVTRVTDTYS